MTSSALLRLVGVAHSRCCGLLGMALHELAPAPIKPGTRPAAMHYYPRKASHGK